ncbi:DUF362 domain-containing protein, partial [candidate division KSB1 bacterium]
IAGVSLTSLGFWLRSRSKKPVSEGIRTLTHNYTVELPAGLPDLVVVSGGEPDQLVEKALEVYGGIQTFISSGDKVVLKPNIGWERVPQQAANTNPDLVKSVVELCLKAGAVEVIVSDVSCNDPRRCFTRSGIARAAEAAGATVVMPEERKFREYRINGEVLSDWPLFTPIIEADKIINMPIVKHHSLTQATMGMKNWYGILGGNRNQLHQSIDLSIADLATFLRPTLTIMDAYRVLMANGPTGGSINDVKTFKTLVAGVDPIAVDAFGATFLDLNPAQIPYLVIGEQRGLGNINLDQINIHRVSID